MAAVLADRPSPPRSEPAPGVRLAGRLCVVVRVDREFTDLAERHRRLAAAVAGLAEEVRFLYLLEGALPTSRERLAELVASGAPVEVLRFPSALGSAAVLTAGLRKADGAYVLVLPADAPVELGELGRLAEAIGNADVVVARRMFAEPPSRLRAGKLESLTRLLLGSPFADLRAEVWLLRRQAADQLVLYGNQHRFLPLIAQMQGLLVAEVPVRGWLPQGAGRRLDLPLVLDLLAVFFLVRFLHKPFRFFGGIGLGVAALGGLATLWLVFERLVLGIALADRPALILSTLLVVLGLQIIAVGLIGELITFAHARHLREEEPERVID